MEVTLLVDLIIEGHPFAIGERVDLSEESAKLLIRKGQAKNDQNVGSDIHSGSVGKRKHGKRKSTPKG